MRIGVIRGDLPGPIFIGDVETISQYDPVIEPSGQTYYIGRPTTAGIEAALANVSTGAGAVLDGADISGSYPITINAGNRTLKLRSASSASWDTFVLPMGTFANEAALLTALNGVLANKGYFARASTTAGGIAIESSVKGVTSYIENDTVLNGSTANTVLGLADGSARTIPAAVLFIAACLPVGGPLDVRSATINSVGVGTSSNAMALIPTSRGTHTSIADAIAPYLYETPTVVTSFQIGMISQYRSASFNPDSHRSLPNGAAISVVQDDGFTPFVAPMPNIVSAVIGGGNLTINGTGLGSYERKVTHVKISGATNKTLEQALIEINGGTVTSTQIVIPMATLLPGLSAVTSSVQVRVDTLASNVVALS